MGLNIRIYNIQATNPFRVSYKTGTTLGSEISGFTNYDGIFPATTTGVTISGITIDYDTNYWIKITDVVTDTYSIENITTCEICGFPAVACDMEVEVECINCELSFEVICYQTTPTPTPTPTNTPTPTIQTTNTPTPSSTNTPTPTIQITLTPTPTQTQVPIYYYGLRRFDGSDGFTTKYYTLVPLSSGQCFCSSGGFKYISSGITPVITGLIQLDGTAMSNCYAPSPCLQ